MHGTSDGRNQFDAYRNKTLIPVKPNRLKTGFCRVGFEEVTGLVFVAQASSVAQSLPDVSL